LVFLFSLPLISKEILRSSANITVIPFTNSISSEPLIITEVNLLITPTQIPASLFSINMNIWIGGTGGDGLRIRDDASQNSTTIYVAADGEMFTIIDGPLLNDGYIWWRIKKYDNSKVIGWAVQDFLEKFPSN